MSLSIRITNGIKSLKEGDTATKIRMLLIGENGVAYDLVGKIVTVILSTKQGKILEKPGVLTGPTGELEFGIDEGDITGSGQLLLEVHVQEVDKTKIFPSRDYVVVSVDKNLNIIGQSITSIQLADVVTEVAGALQISIDDYNENITSVVRNITDNVKQGIIDIAKIDWLSPVNTFEDLAVIYPNATVGQTVMIRADGKVYRFNGITWSLVQEILPTAINELDARLTSLKADKSEVGTKASLKTTDKTNVVNAINEHDNKVRQRDFVRFGIIDLPVDFPKQLPFQLFRDRDGKVKHNINLKSFEPQVRIYVDGKVGADTNSGLTTGLPVKNVSKALQIANARTETIIGIVFLRKLEVYNIFEGQTTPTFTLSKNIVFESNNPEGTFIGTWNNNLTWTLDSGIYRTTRTAAQEVIDYSFKDFRGLPRLLKKTTSLVDCQAQRGTWYTDGSLVYVNRFDGSMPTDEVTVVIPVNCMYDFTISGYKLMFSNVHFWLKSSSGTNPAVKITGDAMSQFVCNKSSFALARGNGLSTIAVGEVYTLETDAFLNGYDGLNYHGVTPISATPYEFVFEYNCYSHDNGFLDGSSGNASTAHEGMTVLRVGTIGHDCYGPLVADVNGCYSVNIDVFMSDSLGSIAITRAAFYFDENNKAKDGYAYLINCGGGGDINTYTVSSDGNVPVYIKNLQGTKINSNTQVSYLL